VPPLREAIEHAVLDARRTRPNTPPAIERWDGDAAARIAAVLCEGARYD
jgi:hypothetical protein